MTNPSSNNPRLDELLHQLPSGLMQHVVRAHRKALELAAIHNVDQNKVGLATLAHDIARNMDRAELLRRATSYGLPLQPVEQRVTALLHGPVGAEMLRRECAIQDMEVIEAVRWHTTFNRGLGPVARVVFLADKLDPEKAGKYPYLERVERLARENLNSAILYFLHEQLGAMIETGQIIHPASIEGRNEMLELQEKR